MNKKAVFSYLLVIVISVFVSWFGASFYQSRMVSIDKFIQYNESDFHRAQITQIVQEREINDEFSMNIYEVTFKATFSSGSMQHRELTLTQGFNEQMLVELYPLNAGDKILLYRNVIDDQVFYDLVGFQRSTQLWILIGLFIILLVGFGKMKGVNAIISLGFTVFAVFFILIPAILAQANLYLLTLVVALFITAMSFALIGGLTKKTLSATLGCVGGMLAATILAILFMGAMQLSGVVSEDFTYLIYIQDEVPINLRGVLFMGIIIGSLGAVMDVAMSISSSLEEIVLNAPNIKPISLIKSGLNIGKDIMGTMANTLILAYMGGSLSTVLLMLVYGRPTSLLIHSEYLASEVLQAIAGSLGILFTIPITAVVSAYLLQKRFINSNPEIES